MVRSSAMNRPRRLAAPTSLGGRPLLEPQHQFLYSSVALANAALPSELNFFSYAKGGRVPGAGNASGADATLFHTNLETPGALAQPKVFTVSGIRVFLPDLAFVTTAGVLNTPTLSDSSVGTALADADLFEDLLLLAFSTVVQFNVGPKTYVSHPSFLLPSNTGIGGLAGAANDNGTAATLNQLDTTTAHLAGVYYGMPIYPVVIASQQSFGAKLLCQWTTNPSMNDLRLVFLFLDGILSREVS